MATQEEIQGPARVSHTTLKQKMCLGKEAKNCVPARDSTVRLSEIGQSVPHTVTEGHFHNHASFSKWFIFNK
jgi:hypothetical protein